MSLAPDTDSNARTWGMLCHVAGLACYSGIPFGAIVAVLVVWLLKREEHPFIEEQGRESLNFQISTTIYVLVCIPFVFVFVGIFMWFAVIIFHLVCTVMAIISANRGETFFYPLSMRLIQAPD